MERPKVRNSIKKRVVKNQGVRNRQAGHNYERQLAKEFREIFGDKYCRTSRQASRLLDDCKVDLDSDFLNVQAKNVISNINYIELLHTIHDALEKDMPKRLVYPISVFHKRGKEEIVVLSKKDFYTILAAYKRELDENKN